MVDLLEMPIEVDASRIGPAALLHVALSTIDCPLIDHYKYLQSYITTHKP
jgi:hypothetical protein